MEVTRIADDLICFSLTTKELQDENIDIRNINQKSYPEQLKPLIDKLMWEAETAYAFKRNGIEIKVAFNVAGGMLNIVLSSTKRSSEEMEMAIAGQERSREIDEMIEDELSVIEENKAKKKCKRQLGIIAEFINLREVTALAKTFKFKGVDSTLYHDNKDNKYILAITSDDAEAIITAGNVIMEYSGKNLMPLRSKHHLDEHMDIIIKKNACGVLGKL